MPSSYRANNAADFSFLSSVTMRNVKISKAKVGISQIWNWGWLYSGLSISDCGTAFSMNNADQQGKLQVGSVVIIDSEITNCPTFVDQVSVQSSCITVLLM
jgi:glucan 1,3-beta-glucosidase